MLLDMLLQPSASANGSHDQDLAPALADGSGSLSSQGQGPQPGPAGASAPRPPAASPALTWGSYLDGPERPPASQTLTWGTLLDGPDLQDDLGLAGLPGLPPPQSQLQPQAQHGDQPAFTDPALIGRDSEDKLEKQRLKNRLAMRSELDCCQSTLWPWQQPGHRTLALATACRYLQGSGSARSSLSRRNGTLCRTWQLGCTRPSWRRVWPHSMLLSGRDEA